MIVKSMIDNDLYKFTMQQVVFHQYPKTLVEYEFVCRNKDIKLGFLAEDIEREIDKLATLKISESEIRFLRGLGFFKDDYLEWLQRYYHHKTHTIDVVNNIDGDLKISIKGYWEDTILFEVPILSIVNQLYFRSLVHKKAMTSKKSLSDVKGEIRREGMIRLQEKINILKASDMSVAEFGTRRRFSQDWQEEVVENLKPYIIGTSNVYLAWRFGLTPIGTMAHEFISAHIGLTKNIKEAQKAALYSWLQEYDNNLGIALTDTFTSKAFFQDCGHILSNAFSGLRHDSGCPRAFANKAINHYKEMGIDPRTKTIVFSDALDCLKAIHLYKEFYNKINVSFGIGTNFTNDVGFETLSIVIKLINCNEKPVVKLSDDPSKAIGDKQVVEEIKKAYEL